MHGDTAARPVLACLGGADDVGHHVDGVALDDGERHRLGGGAGRRRCLPGDRRAGPGERPALCRPFINEIVRVRLLILDDRRQPDVTVDFGPIGRLRQRANDGRRVGRDDLRDVGAEADNRRPGTRRPALCGAGTPVIARRRLQAGLNAKGRLRRPFGDADRGRDERRAVPAQIGLVGCDLKVVGPRPCRCSKTLLTLSTGVPVTTTSSSGDVGTGAARADLGATGPLLQALHNKPTAASAAKPRATDCLFTSDLASATGWAAIQHLRSELECPRQTARRRLSRSSTSQGPRER